MKIESIEKLRSIESRRSSLTGYMVNKDRVRISEKNLRKVTIADAYDNVAFDKYIVKAILEKESELINRAFELEEIEYQEISEKAKLEAASILVGKDLIIKI